MWGRWQMGKLIILPFKRYIHTCIGKCHLYNWVFLRFYLFRQRGRERGREGEKHQCVVASHTPPTGDLACNPGMCLRLGIEPATLWFTGRCSIHWATPARAEGEFLNVFLVDFMTLEFWYFLFPNAFLYKCLPYWMLEHSTPPSSLLSLGVPEFGSGP